MCEVDGKFEHSEKLRRIGNMYRRQRDKGLNDKPCVRSVTLRRLRRIRKNLKRIGYRVKEAVDGEVTLRRRKPRLVRNSDDHIHAKRIEAYILENRLFYGDESRNQTSWSLGLSTLSLPDSAASFLRDELPVIVDEYAAFCRLTIEENVLGRRNDWAVLQGVADELVELWRLELSTRASQPFCFRPDLIVTEDGVCSIIEFNVDSRLDLGIACGVNEYSLPLLRSGERLISHNLVNAYAELKPVIPFSIGEVAVTITSSLRRAEYRCQERYFCDIVNNKSGVNWLLREISELEFDAKQNKIRDRATGKLVDFVRLELDILNSCGQVDPEEFEFVRSFLTKTDTPLVGSLLPFADKMLLAAALSSDKTSDQLKAAICPTRICGPGEYADVLEARINENHMVLKKCGVFGDTTGSKGVVISSDVDDDEWLTAVSRLIEDCGSGRAAWVMQPRLEPQTHSVRFRRRALSHTRHADCFVRLSPFYTQRLDRNCSSGFQLSGVVATAGTDRETIRYRHYKIRALRESTYLAVTELGLEQD